ncbi:MAG: hypothetical protein IPM07_25420 [Anaerolineales bacterium]|nr:hypothetical protein [Anaerolineales bacterium]
MATKQAQVFTVFGFNGNDDDSWSYRLHAVAASDSAEAESIYRSQSNGYPVAYVMTDEVMEHLQSRQCVSFGICSGEMSDNEFRKWVASNCRSHMESGELIPASFRLVAASRKTLPTSIQRAEMAFGA